MHNEVFLNINILIENVGERNHWFIGSSMQHSGALGSVAASQLHVLGLVLKSGYCL